MFKKTEITYMKYKKEITKGILVSLLSTFFLILILINSDNDLINPFDLGIIILYFLLMSFAFTKMYIKKKNSKVHQ